jgi:DNA-binding protein WhiA
MSFSLDVKNEASRNLPKKRCCELAEIAGFMRIAGSIKLSGKGRMGVTMVTQNPAITRHIKTLFTKCYGISVDLMVGEGGFNKNRHLYELVVTPENNGQQILRESGILNVREGSNYISEGIDENIIKSKCCKKRYLKGLFLGGGTMSDPAKGYHFEISTHSQILANDIRKLINSFVDLHARISKRKDSYVVYVKDSEQIKDILNIIDAHSQLLKFENVRIYKEVRNKTNRINNCEYANMDKMLSAANKQIQAIEHIKSKVGIDSLPGKLLDTALVRLNNPQASLMEIGEMLDPPIKKSSVYHRLKQIEEISNKIE